MKTLFLGVAILASGFCNAPFVKAQQITATQALVTGSAPSSTVAGLPTCNASLNGQIYFVTNLLTPTVLGTAIGGGAVQALVHCNGTNWIVG